MELTQVKGNTWVAEGMGLIPLYKLDERRCVLLDTGLGEEREELEEALRSAGLTPAGVLCSHAHVDHCGNNRYFQETYGAQIALTGPGAENATVRLIPCIQTGGRTSVLTDEGEKARILDHLNSISESGWFDADGVLHPPEEAA